jgi:putative ABC transport system substrate-binding protein
MLKRRRLFAASAGLVLASRTARAASRTIGWVSPESRETTAPFFEAFHGALRDGLKGDEVRIVERYAPKGPDDIAAAVTDLERQGVALIVSQGAATPTAVRTAKKVPIVFGFSADPIVAGVAQSLARPGGNATGISFMSVELMAKRIDFLRMAVPASRKLALLSNVNHSGEEREIATCQGIVEPAGVELMIYRIKAADEIAPAVERALQDAQAVLLLPSATMVRAAPSIAAQCLVRRVPLVSGWATIAHAGGLMTYGPNLQAAYRRLANFAIRVLDGAQPADLPIEQPTILELVLNRRTAETIGVRFPQTLVAQAEEIIE